MLNGTNSLPRCYQDGMNSLPRGYQTQINSIATRRSRPTKGRSISRRLGLNQLLTLIHRFMESRDEVLQGRRRDRQRVRVATAVAIGKPLTQDLRIDLQVQQPPPTTVRLDQPLVGVAVASPPQPGVQHHISARLDQLDQAAAQLLDHRPFPIEVLLHRIVRPATEACRQRTPPRRSRPGRSPVRERPPGRTSRRIRRRSASRMTRQSAGLDYCSCAREGAPDEC
jgi:hypothetical protein